jgi:hypothetical protein
VPELATWTAIPEIVFTEWERGLQALSPFLILTSSQTTGGYPAVVIDQCRGDLSFLTHTFKAASPDDPVFQLQSGHHCPGK